MFRILTAIAIIGWPAGRLFSQSAAVHLGGYGVT
jgi:hypothetical protein